MTHEAFVALLEERIGKMRATLAAKSAEYSSGSDKLHNFKEAARLKNESPEEALVGMLVKHWVSIMDIVNGIKWNKPVLIGQIDEKIGDAINYLVLLEALLKE